MNMHGTYAGCAKKLHYNTLRLKQNTILLSRPYIQLARSNNTRQHTHTNITKAGENKGNQGRYLWMIVSMMIWIELALMRKWMVSMVWFRCTQPWASCRCCIHSLDDGYQCIQVEQNHQHSPIYQVTVKTSWEKDCKYLFHVMQNSNRINLCIRRWNIKKKALIR